MPKKQANETQNWSKSQTNRPR